MLILQMIEKLLIIKLEKILIKLFFLVTKEYYSFKLLINYNIFIDLSVSEFKRSFLCKIFAVKNNKC